MVRRCMRGMLIGLALGASGSLMAQQQPALEFVPVRPQKQAGLGLPVTASTPLPEPEAPPLAVISEAPVLLPAPVLGGPALGQPSAVEPSAVQQHAMQPHVVQPHAVQPYAVQPHVVQPHAVQQYPIQPYPVQPQAVQPQVVQPTIVQPEVVEPSSSQPSPISRAQVIEAPFSEAPVSEAPAGPSVNLDMLWQLAQENHGELRESLALVDEARGRRIQAGLYPNPTLDFLSEDIGSGLARQGDYAVMLSQEILTGNKRNLDKAMAGRQTYVAGWALEERRFEVLTRLRRGYYEFLGLLQEAHLLREAGQRLEKRHAEAKLLEERAKVLGRADVLDLELLLEEVRIQEAQAGVGLSAAWNQLVAEAGAPEMPMPGAVADRPRQPPRWTLEGIEQRVLTEHSSLKRAQNELEAARLGWERARADAVPNVTVGGGWKVDNTGGTQGGIVSFTTPLPVWDRKQGKIREAEAAYARAQAAIRTTEQKLLGQVREAWGRYLAGVEQVQRINQQTLPRHTQRAELIQQAYQARADTVNFNDLFIAEQNVIQSQVKLAEARRNLWRAVADLQGLMQVDLAEEVGGVEHSEPQPAPVRGRGL